SSPGNFRQQSQQPIEAENRVVQIAFAAAILESSVFVLLALQKMANEFSGFSQKLGRQPRDLQHFQAEAHGSAPEGSCKNNLRFWSTAHPAPLPSDGSICLAYST